MRNIQGIWIIDVTELQNMGLDSKNKHKIQSPDFWITKNWVRKPRVWAN
jgi:hypothetical protein